MDGLIQLVIAVVLSAIAAFASAESGLGQTVLVPNSEAGGE